MTGTRGPRSSLLLVERVVLAALSDSIAYTRADLIAATGLSRAVVTAAVASLVARGELIEVDRPAATGIRGRPSTRYRRAALLPPVLLLRLHKDTATTLELLTDDRSSHPPTAGLPWSSPWDEWSAVVHDAADRLVSAVDAEPRLVVISAPFPVEDARGQPRFHSLPPGPRRNPKRPPPQPDWLAVDPRPRVAELLSCPTVMVNDANLAALGEAVFGAGRGYRAVVHLSVLDGIGAGLVFGGTLYSGASGFAGELAHVQVAEDGDFCVCGNRGCLATETRGPRVTAALGSIYGQEITFEDVRAQLAKNDPIALRFFRDLGATLGRPVATILTMLDPDCLIVDGDLAEAAGPLTDGLTAELAQRCQPALLSRLTITRGALANPIASGAVASANTLVGTL